MKQKENIPCGQFLRAKKNVKEANKTMTGIETKFTKRGYPTNKIKEQKQKAGMVNREELLQEKDKTSSKRIPFTTTFNKNLPNISSTIDKHWHLL